MAREHKKRGVGNFLLVDEETLFSWRFSLGDSLHNNVGRINAPNPKLPIAKSGKMLSDVCSTALKSI